jgi:ABC-type antimicrobial peptide transport system permease subunit
MRYPSTNLAFGTVGEVKGRGAASERTKEIGIRMALGAQAPSIVWLFIRNSLFLAAIGSAIGLATAYLVVTLLSRILPVLPGKAPLGVIATALLLIAVALFASWVPARRTTKINPTIALRSD